MAFNVGSLVVELSANVARLQADINVARASVDRGMGAITKSAQVAQAALGALGVGLTAGALTSAIKGTIDFADNINDLSQRLGISIRELGMWKLAAQQSGADLGVVARGVKALSTSMVEHAERFRKAGITATNANDALLQLSDIFRALPDGIQKTSLAVELFGKAGLDLIPMLNQGSAGLAEAQAMAREYGDRLAALAPHADKFNDLMEELKLQSSAAGFNIAEKLVPALNKFLEVMNKTGLSGAIGATVDRAITGGNIQTRIRELQDQLEGKQAWLAEQELKGQSVFYPEIAKPGLMAGMAITRGELSSLQSMIDGMKELAAQEALAGSSASYSNEQRRSSSKSMAEAAEAAKILAGGARSAREEVDKLASVLGKINDKDSGLDASFWKDLQTLHDGYKAGRLTVDQYRDAVGKLTMQQRFYQDQLRGANQVVEDAMALEEKQIGVTEGAIRAVREKIEAIELDGKTMLMASDERERYIALQALEAEKVHLTAEAYEQLRERLLSALDNRAALRAYRDGQAEMWGGIEQTAHQTFISIFDSGKDAFDRLRDTLKNGLYELLYQMTLKRWLIQLAVGVGGEGMATSAFGQGAVNSALSGGSSLSGITNLASGWNGGGAFGGAVSGYAGNGIAWLGDRIGSESLSNYGFSLMGGQSALPLGGMLSAYQVGGAKGFAVGAGSTALAGGIGGMASGAGFMSGASGALAGMGPWGWAALAAAAILGMNQNGGTPHAGGIAFSGGEGYATPGTQAGIRAYYADQGAADQMVMSDWTKRFSKATADALGPAAEGFAKTFNEIAKANGLAGGYQFGLAFSADGEDPVRARSSILDAAGKQLAWTKDYNKLGDDPQQGLQLMLTEQVPRLMLTALEGMDLNALAESFLDTLDIEAMSAEAVQQAIAFVQATDEIVSAFGRLGIGANEVTAQLISALGGMEQAVAGLNAYYEGYFSEAERTAHLTENLREQFGLLNLEMPATRSEFRSLVESIDLTSSAGATTYAALIGMAGAFGTVADAAAQSTASVVEAAAAAVTDNFTKERLVGGEVDRAAGDIATAWQDIADSIVETARRLRGDLLDEAESYARLQADFAMATAAARAGDDVAAGKLSDLAASVVEAAKLVSVTGADYNLVAARTIASLNTTAETLHDKYGVKIPGFAAGGWHAGGYAIVGESGPELAYMPPARVYSSTDSRALLDIEPLVAEIRRLETRLAAIERHAESTAKATNGEGRAPILVETA